MSPDAKKKLEETAYHEAGHAVLAIASGVQIPYLSIIPQEGYDGGCDVDCEVAFLSATNQGNREVNIDLGLLRYVCFLAAGKQAQRKYLCENGIIVEEDKMDLGAREDYRLISEKFAFLNENGHEQINLHNLLPQIDDFFEVKDVWSAVQAVAARLLDVKEMHDIFPEEFKIPHFTPTRE